MDFVGSLSSISLFSYGFQAIGDLLGGWATALFGTIIGLVLVRIVMSFVFKLFRMRINYDTYSNKLHGTTFYEKRNSMK